MKIISIVVACYNERDNLIEMHDRIKSTFTHLSYGYELIYVDNASTDDSRVIYHNLVQQDSSVKVIFMARNLGTSQTSFFAGICNAKGDAVVLLDGDLQDPPELIPAFIEQWEKGHEVVYAVRAERKGSLIRRICYWGFYRVFKWLSYLDIPLDSGDFGLMDRRVVAIISKLPEKDLFLRGLRAWVGFSQVGVPYKRPDRKHGDSRISFFANFSWAKRAIVNFSTKPLEYISRLAVMAIIVTLIASCFYLYRFMQPNTPRGFPTLLMVIFIFGTIQLLALSIISEYLLRIFQEVKARPPYIIQEILEQKKH